MEIPDYVLEKLTKWNKNDAVFDGRFVGALLLSLTDLEEILRNEIPEEVTNFVNGTKILKTRFVF